MSCESLCGLLCSRWVGLGSMPRAPSSDIGNTYVQCTGHAYRRIFYIPFFGEIDKNYDSRFETVFEIQTCDYNISEFF